MLGRALIVAAAVFAGGVSSAVFDAPTASAASCAESASAEDLDEFFGADEAAGLVGADYPHAFDLPDGRTLWMFQDAFLGRGDRLDTALFAHNAALVQDGNCFTLLPSSGGSGTSWIGSWVEEGLEHWFWPLDAEVGADGNLWLFLAEVRNPNGSGAASGAKPVATWRARLSLPDLELVDLEPAADPSASLYGYSIVSDASWTYLYGHCYRQFVADAGFDTSCSPHTYVARVPRGQLDTPPKYWDGTTWSTDEAQRVPVLTAQHSMPVSVQRFGDVFIAASDEDDWFGSDVIVRASVAPQGPWIEVARYTPALRCDDGCNNYGAFVLPDLEDGRLVIAQSNNAWDMHGRAFPDASLYRIDVRTVDVPGVLPAASASPTTVADPPAAGLAARPAIVRLTAAEAVAPHVRVLHAATTWSTADPPFPVALRILGLAICAVVAGASAMGFATTFRRRNPARRSHALVRVRSGGATRAHRVVADRERETVDAP